MRRITFLCLFLFSFSQINAQIEAAVLLGNKYPHSSFGFGAFLNVGIPVSDAGYGTIEAAADFFLDWSSGGEYGIALVPVMVGYKHTLNGTGLGWYVQPQAGYNIVGAISNDYVDEKIHGFAWAGTFGYLFNPGNRIQFDIGLRYESVLYKGGSINFVALRIAHSFLIGRRDR